MQSQAKELFTPAQVKEMFEVDFQGRCNDKNVRSLSVEDQRFLDTLEEGMHKREDGHYQEPMTRSLQLYCVRVTAFSQTDLFLD